MATRQKCRICLTNTKRSQLKSMFEDGEKLATMFKSVTGLPVPKTSVRDPPAVICVVCAANLQTAEEFKKNCLNYFIHFTKYSTIGSPTDDLSLDLSVTLGSSLAESTMPPPSFYVTRRTRDANWVPLHLSSFFDSTNYEHSPSKSSSHSSAFSPISTVVLCDETTLLDPATIDSSDDTLTQVLLSPRTLQYSAMNVAVQDLDRRSLQASSFFQDVEMIRSSTVNPLVNPIWDLQATELLSQTTVSNPANDETSISLSESTFVPLPRKSSFIAEFSKGSSEDETIVNNNVRRVELELANGVKCNLEFTSDASEEFVRSEFRKFCSKYENLFGDFESEVSLTLQEDLAEKTVEEIPRVVKPSLPNQEAIRGREVGSSKDEKKKSSSKVASTSSSSASTSEDAKMSKKSKFQEWHVEDLSPIPTVNRQVNRVSQLESWLGEVKSDVSWSPRRRPVRSFKPCIKYVFDED